MKKIIVPMDFTEVAMNAFRYAYDLFPDDELHIVHAISGVVSTREPIYLKPGMTKDMILKTELEKQIMSNIGVTELPSRISVQILLGEVVPSIRNIVEKEDIDMMVVGTRDKYDLVDRWIGTFSLGLVKTINIPTYLIPRYATYQPFDKVMVASDHHLKDTDFLDQIKKWNVDYGAFIRFLHIKNKDKDSFETEQETIIHDLFEVEEAQFGFDVEVIKDRDVSKSLLANAYNYKADLLVVIPDNQSFIGAFLFKSISKELILKSNVPLLFLHPNKIETDLIDEQLSSEHHN